MDYEALSMLVPKNVINWTFPDIKRWLHFIHMQNLLPLFEKQQLNGQSLMKINSKNLSQMGIQSNIMQKKLIIWIEKGFSSFDQYLQKDLQDKQNICPNFNKRLTQRQSKNKQMFKPIAMQIEPKPSVDQKLKITLYQGPQNVYYIADSKGLKIGRALTNQIQSLQVTVQNQHSQIVMQNGNFYLLDMGTKSGTFVKVHYKIELLVGMLIQIGSYLLKVQQLNANKQILIKCIKLGSNISEHLNIDFNQKTSYSFGRRNNNDFAREDQHMSGTHAKIYFFNGRFILEDMGSTNGTWLRLSNFQKMSNPHKLEDGHIFKVGNTITYICNYENERDCQKMQIEENNHICMKCNNRGRNILFMPCKHTVNCEDCCTQTLICPLCNHRVEEKVKIFI